jgi:hypothetical protein
MVLESTQSLTEMSTRNLPPRPVTRTVLLSYHFYYVTYTAYKFNMLSENDTPVTVKRTTHKHPNLGCLHPVACEIR